MTVLLKHLIMEHRELFKELYPDGNLIPKHHFMMHYPFCIGTIPPLILYMEHEIWGEKTGFSKLVFNTSITSQHLLPNNIKCLLHVIGRHHIQNTYSMDLWNVLTWTMRTMVMRWLQFCMTNLYCKTPMQQTELQWVGQSTGYGINNLQWYWNARVLQNRKKIIIDNIICFLVNKLMVDHFREQFRVYKVSENNYNDVILVILRHSIYKVLMVEMRANISYWPEYKTVFFALK